MSRRRVKIGVHKQYDRRFDILKSRSQVLNPTANQISWQALEMGDEQGLRSVLAEVKLKLLRAERVVAQCDKEFEELKAMCVNAGGAIPAERDHKAQVEYLDALASADVTAEEVDKLQGLVDKFTRKKQVAEAVSVLKYGPCGVGKIGKGILSVLDGQDVKVNDDGLLVISDDRSPYDGMAVEDYKKHVVLPWLAAHKRTCTIDRASLPPWPVVVAREKAETK